MIEPIYLDGGKPPWPCTVRGVHNFAQAWHSTWLKDWHLQAQMDSLLARMRLSWVTLLSDGGSVLEQFTDLSDGKTKTAAEWFLDRRVVPLVREQGMMNQPFTGGDAVKRMAEIWARYGMKPQIMPGNEPGDSREWGGKRPNDWRERVVDRFRRATDTILAAGGLALFHDPLAEWDWWFEQMQDMAPLWRDRKVGMAAHLYGVGRPPGYPYGPEIQQRQHITEAEWLAALDDFVDHPHFTSKTVDMINACRDTWPNPATVWDDPTCFGAWRVIRDAARRWFGCEIAMCMTEGGWTPRDNAHRDDRYPYTTPKQVGRYTLDVFNATDHGLYAITPWVINGEPGWYTESWVGGAYAETVDRDTGQVYGYEKPIVRMLEADTPPPEPPPPPPPEPQPDLAAKLAQLRVHLAQIADLWRQVQEAIPSTRSL